jgi:hypothetical protein
MLPDMIKHRSEVPKAVLEKPTSDIVHIIFLLFIGILSFANFLRWMQAKGSVAAFES